MSVRVSEREKALFIRRSKYCELNSVTDFQKKYCFLFLEAFETPSSKCRVTYLIPKKAARMITTTQ